uniref:Dynactin subunit 4 n=1 Tax=Trichuris muris TaxID=70415 RepID=A0A5S6Q379_TRIMR
MSTLYDVDVTKYRCTCGSWSSLCRLYFCKYCLVLRCTGCTTSEVDSLFCPSCLENMTSSEARTHKNRCNSCYECPCCDQLLSLRVIQSPTSNSADCVESNAEAKEPSVEKLYRLYCQYCCWSSQQAGLPDQTIATRAWPEATIVNEKSLNKAAEHFSHLAAIEKFEATRRSFFPKRFSLFQYHPERFAYHNIFSKLQSGKTDNESAEPDDSSKAACVPSEDVEPLDESIFSRQINVANLTTMSQRLKIPEMQPLYVNELLPLRKSLVVRKSIRCRSCEHNVIRGEYVPSSVKFKIQFCAMLLIPEVRLLRRPVADDDQFPVFLTVTNFGLTTMTILLLPDAEYDDESLSVVFPPQEILIGKHDEPSIYTKRGQKVDPLSLFTDDSQFVVPMSDHKVLVRLKVTVRQRLPNAKLYVLVKHHCENTLLKPVGESKSPEMVWLDHHVKVTLFDEPTAAK